MMDRSGNMERKRKVIRKFGIDELWKQKILTKLS